MPIILFKANIRLLNRMKCKSIKAKSDDNCMDCIACHRPCIYVYVMYLYVCMNECYEFHFIYTWNHTTKDSIIPQCLWQNSDFQGLSTCCDCDTKSLLLMFIDYTVHCDYSVQSNQNTTFNNVLCTMFEFELYPEWWAGTHWTLNIRTELVSLKY